MPKWKSFPHVSKMLSLTNKRTNSVVVEKRYNHQLYIHNIFNLREVNKIEWELSESTEIKLGLDGPLLDLFQNWVNIPVIYSRWRPLIKYRNFFDCLLLLYYKSKWPQLLTSATWQLRSVWYFPGFLWFCFSANLYRLNKIFYKHIFKLDKLFKKKHQRKRVIYF